MQVQQVAAWQVSSKVSTAQYDGYLASRKRQDFDIGVVVLYQMGCGGEQHKFPARQYLRLAMAGLI